MAKKMATNVTANTTSSAKQKNTKQQPAKAVKKPAKKQATTSKTKKPSTKKAKPSPKEEKEEKPEKKGLLKKIAIGAAAVGGAGLALLAAFNGGKAAGFDESAQLFLENKEQNDSSSEESTES